MKRQERIVLNNIIIDTGKKYLIMNLINFRREYVNEEQLKMMRFIGNKKFAKEKLLDKEQAFYEELLAKRQVLTDEMISMYEEKRKEMELEKLEIQPYINSIVINLSYKCNFKCDYCYQKGFSANERMTEEKVEALYIFLKDYAKKCDKPFRLESITISGGEPLLDENVNAVKCILNRFDKICKNFVLYTNGALLTRQMDKIDFSKITSLQISIDGNDEVMKTINHNQKNNLLDNILKSIDVLKRDKKRKITIPIMLCEVVVENIQNLIKEFEKHDLFSADNVGIYVLPDLNFDEGDRMQCLYKDGEEYIRLNNRVKDKIKEKNIQIGHPRSISAFYKALIRQSDEQWQGKAISCSMSGIIPVTFGPEGNVYWCTCVDQEKGIIGKYYPDAYIDECRIQEYRKRTIYSQEECQKCEFRYVCGGGCRLNLIANNTKLDCGLWNDQYFLENVERFFSWGR